MAFSISDLSRAIMTNITRILNAIEQGDARAIDQLLPAVYQELRQLAAWKLSHELPGQTLQATALVHEAYIRLVGNEAQDWKSRGHFFAAAAEAMRRILVENARRKRSLKRGGNRQQVRLEESLLVDVQEIQPDELLALNDALDKLSEEDKMASDLIKLRIFGGFTVKQAAEMTGVSASKAYADLQYARAWLRLEIGKTGTTSDL